MEGEMVMMQDLFEFKRTGIERAGEVLGQFRRHRYSFDLLATGSKPAGYKLDGKSSATGWR